MTVAIVGGGFLGSALAAALPPPVLVITRSGGDDSIALDILRSPNDAIASALAPARALVIAIAPGRDQDRRELYVEGTRRILEATREVAWRRIVFVGSTSALPDRDAWLDETCDELPDNERGLVQRDAEAVVRDHAVECDRPWFVLRLGGLWGPGRPIGQIYRRRGDAPLPGDGNTPTNLVHRDDAVQAIVAALAAPASMRGIVHVCGDEHTTSRIMYARVGADVRWESEPAPNAAPHGKRVGNLRLKSLLQVRLLHPGHR